MECEDRQGLAGDCRLVGAGYARDNAPRGQCQGDKVIIVAQGTAGG
ncbi:MAG: hypothetical protein HY231_19675 [Acidobacteria bacterium]|nr:hypothetical protein [Acidobacteriota bacterium]